MDMRRVREDDNDNDNNYDNDNDDDGYVTEWLDKLSNEQSTAALRTFIESLGPQIKSADRMSRERAVKRISLVISKLSQNYTWHLALVELLLDFLLTNYDTCDSSHHAMLGAIKNLIMNSSHLAAGYIQTVVEKLYCQGRVQTCAQKERYLFFQILDILLEKYHEELSANVYFISYFISSVSGERDPRCLVIVFRLFCIICSYFNSGKFPRNLFDIHANELFDVIACYYPIEFKQSSKERTEITRDLLSSGCENCLLADSEFAPFVFELIIEKITDDEYSMDSKLEVHTFLAKACEFFSAYQLSKHIDELCAGIRSVLLNLPKSSTRDNIPAPIEDAISSILRSVEKGSLKIRKQQIEHICQQFIDNCEMFVLQAELGLSGRVLSFFEILIRSSEFAVEIVSENVFSWLLSLCKGDTANFAANKSEIIDDSLKILCHWIDLALHFKQITLMQRYHTRFIEMLDKYDRDIAKRTRYKLLQACIDLHVQTNALLDKCRVFLRKSLDLVCTENKELRNSSLFFVHAFAVAHWAIVKDILINEINGGREISHLAPVLWSTIHSGESLDFALSYLTTLLPSTSAWSDDLQEAFIGMFNWNKSKNNTVPEALLRETLACIFTRLELGLESGKDLEALATFLQQIGLVVDDWTHLQGFHEIEEKLKNCPAILPGVYLYILQSADDDKLLSILAQLSHSDCVGQELIWYKALILAAAVNKSSNYAALLADANKFRENLKSVDSFKFSCRLCAALLLAGHTEGCAYFTELLGELVEHFDSADMHVVMNAIVDMLTFDKCYSDPAKCRYRTTVLWQQRIFCQLVPIYVNFFNDLNKESRPKRTSLFALLSPLFTLAGTTTAPMNDQYVKLLPVLCAALDTPGLEASTEDLIISGLAKLLKNTTAKQLGDDFLLKVLPRLQYSLDNDKDLKIHLASLECLQLISQRWPPSVLLPFYSPIVCSLIKISRSQKRIVRRSVANVRNLWELLPTK